LPEPLDVHAGGVSVWRSKVLTLDDEGLEKLTDEPWKVMEKYERAQSEGPPERSSKSKPLRRPKARRLMLGCCWRRL
jgi:hypothetical protein